jgi:DNA helicase MCM8
LKSPLLSRFDLIFILLDRPNADHDRFLSNHILNIHTGGGADTHRGNNDASEQDGSLISNLRNPPPVTDIVPPSLLRKYISYARTHCAPKLSAEASVIIKEFYMELRGQNRNDGTPITTRQLESLLRLCEARAKCELRDVVTMADAREVVEIMKSSL